MWYQGLGSGWLFPRDSGEWLLFSAACGFDSQSRTWLLVRGYHHQLLDIIWGLSSCLKWGAKWGTIIQVLPHHSGQDPEDLTHPSTNHSSNCHSVPECWQKDPGHMMTWSNLFLGWWGAWFLRGIPFQGSRWPCQYLGSISVGMRWFSVLGHCAWVSSQTESNVQPVGSRSKGSSCISTSPW